MLELQALPGKVSEKFDRTRRFSDIDEQFRREDQRRMPHNWLFSNSEESYQFVHLWERVS